jgi:hypothetical protein
MTWHLDRFSSLDHLPRKMRPTEMQEAVVAVLRRTPRYSTFEASERPDIVAVIAALERAGRVRKTESEYPWHEVEVLDPPVSS